MVFVPINRPLKETKKFGERSRENGFRTISTGSCQPIKKANLDLDDVLPLLLHDEGLLEVGHLVYDSLLCRRLQHVHQVHTLLAQFKSAQVKTNIVIAVVGISSLIGIAC